MNTVEIHRHIEAPPGQIWSLISDIRRVREWATMTEELIETSENPLQEGSVYRERSKIGPYLSESEWKVTTFEPGDVQVHVCDEPAFRARLRMALEKEGAGTTLDFRADYELMPSFRPLGRLLEKLFAAGLIERNFADTVDNIAELSEASSQTMTLR